MDVITNQIWGGLSVSIFIIAIVLSVFVGWCSAMFCTWLFAPPRANPFKRGQLKRRMIEALIFSGVGPIGSFAFMWIGIQVGGFLALPFLFLGFWAPTVWLACVLNDLDFTQGILFAASYEFIYFAAFWLIGWLFGASPPEEKETVAILQWIMDNGLYFASCLR
jgi:hypothetical protein